ncbi:MAG: ATP-binding protein [Dehalococcoidales bacterium]|nr:ATP-binding protein [Dehalococcoidales bacterium]
MTEEKTRKLGIVVAGSLNKGVEVRLDGSVPVEDMAVGRYVTIEGQKRRFFGMITDVLLGVTDEQITYNPPGIADPFISEVLNGTSTYGMLHVVPYLIINTLAGADDKPQPVKTIPAHFAPVNLAAERDIELVFGKEDKQRFWIGNPLDMETKLCLNLEEFVRRSNGIFGKSGTGKTFFTRMLLVGMLQKSKAANLIFDMQNEYGWSGTQEGGPPVKGLKQLFPEKVAVFTLDKENSLQRGVSTDFDVRIGYDEIEPEDIALLRQTLNLTEPAVEAIYQLRRALGKNWFNEVTQMQEEDTAELLNRTNIHESTFQNLQRGLATIRRLPFIEPHAPSNAVKAMMEHLERGVHVVLEFGRFKDITTYVLVANLLSRRIYARYQDRTEKAMGGKGQEPIPLVITIEEAHKFLNPEVANQTIFGTIAREMRKYNVTLLVIDQRPSGIDEEVMSQLGTKVCYLLDNEKDVDAVMSGVSGKNELKSVLARLAAQRQALIFGHALPMPVAFQPREYGSPESYEQFKSKPEPEKDIEELWK